MDNLQSQVCGILSNVQLVKDNLMRVQLKVMKELRKLEDELILLADKGNTT